MLKKMCTTTCLLMSVIATPAFGETYTVGVEQGDLAPYYYNDNDRYEGFFRRLMGEFADAQDLTLKYKPMPISRLFDSFVKGDIDFKLPANPNWSQEIKKGKELHYTDPVVDYIDGTLVHSDQVGEGEDALRTLGILRGFTPWDYKDAVDSGRIELNKTRKASSLLRMAEGGRVDGVYYNAVAAEKLIEEQGLAVAFDEDLPHTRGQYMLASKEHPELIQKFNSFLKQNSETVENLKSEYDLQEF